MNGWHINNTETLKCENIMKSERNISEDETNKLNNTEKIIFKRAVLSFLFFCIIFFYIIFMFDIFNGTFLSSFDSK